jgi:DNA-binding LacI/PurR family transcriptional regulator
MWKGAVRPHGLIVYADVAVRGVAWGILEKQVSVPKDLRLILHKNKGIRFDFPFPATWITTDIREVAQAYIEQIRRQFAGERLAPICAPFHLEKASKRLGG